MKRFTFRLESLRALREQTEEQAKAALGRALAAEAARHAVAAAAARRLASAGAHADGSGFDLVARQAYVERCERELALAELQLSQARAEVSVCRHELVASSRERETLERLKDRRRREHEAEGRKAEDAVLSEVGLTLYRSRCA